MIKEKTVLDKVLYPAEGMPIQIKVITLLGTANVVGILYYRGNRPSIT